MIALDQLLWEWFPEQRWFPGRGREIKRLQSTRVAVLQEEYPRVEIHIATVDFADEHGPGRESYQVPLSFYQHSDHTLTHALLGDCDNPETGQTEWVHDALRDRSATRVWLELLANGSEVGAVRFHVEPDAKLPPIGLYGDILMVEQSNTSLVFGDSSILKLFRKLEPGINPDIEIHEALRPAHSCHIAELLGHVSVSWTEPPSDDRSAGIERESSLAMLQTFLNAGSDGWSTASASVRDLYAEADLHPSEVGGDFSAEAERLGQATAAVHADLARLMPTEVVGKDRITKLADGMIARLETACAVVPELKRHAPALRTAYDALREREGDLLLQRIHGDLHLGQVMRTALCWTLIDFEGEPARPIEARRALDSPLRDVASMLRSFEYVAGYLLVDGMSDEAQLAYRATEWSDRNRQAFCDGYAQEAGWDPRDDAVVLRSFEVDKAVYEAMYEARHRPSWLVIPLRSLERLTAELTA